jgi:hypothetical protein
MSPQVGERVVLAHYNTSAGKRAVLGQRVNGIVRVSDRPADGSGRAFLVERGLTSKAELDALVLDYVDQSKRRDEPAALVRVGDDLTERLWPSELRHV